MNPFQLGGVYFFLNSQGFTALVEAQTPRRCSLASVSANLILLPLGQFPEY
jgi:hypothetical protein